MTPSPWLVGSVYGLCGFFVTGLWMLLRGWNEVCGDVATPSPEGFEAALWSVLVVAAAVGPAIAIRSPPYPGPFGRVLAGVLAWAAAAVDLLLLDPFLPGAPTGGAPVVYVVIIAVLTSMVALFALLPGFLVELLHAVTKPTATPP